MSARAVHSTPSSSPHHPVSPPPSNTLQTALIYVLASASRSFMHSLNSTEVHNAQAMERALQRPSGQALITVCNHVAAMDDPLVLSTVVPPTLYSKAEHIRQAAGWGAEGRVRRGGSGRGFRLERQEAGQGESEGAATG